ncbi:unnamed protein product, partial [Adineta ricciae]
FFSDKNERKFSKNSTAAATRPPPPPQQRQHRYGRLWLMI